MTMHWFGTRAFSHACEPELHMPTPVGTQCSYCEEPIVDGDEGYLTPCVGPDQIAAIFRKDDEGLDRLEKVDQVYTAEHAECALVKVAGHVRCLLTHGPSGVCPEHVERDPHGMSKRQAATLAEWLALEAIQGRLTPQRKAELFERYFVAEVRRN